jgi:outer membrane immunogenic protein
MKIKGLFLASAAIAALPIGAASATDLPVRMPVKAAPMAPPPFNWTGFYVGANAGVLWGHSVQTVDIDTFGGVPADTSTFSGFIGGVQAGYNWQFSNVVLGIEADIDGASARKSVASSAFDTHNMALNWLGTVRGRAGLAFDRFLPYFTGGVAFAGLKNEIVDTGVPFGTVNRGNTATGWTVGGGLEYAFDNHWSAKAEYLYVKLPDKTVALASGGYNFQFTFKDTEQLARIGLNYRF